MMRILRATYQSRESFLDNLHLSGSIAHLAVATRAEFRDDEPLVLEIGYPGLPNRILIRATAEAPPGHAAEDGTKWFRLDDSEELQRDFLIAVASRRAQATLKRRHTRVPLRMPARVLVEGDDATLVETADVQAETADMAAGGVALKTMEPLPDGARVTVVLEPGDGSEAFEIPGQVVWNREDDDTVEVGIQFDRQGGDSLRRLRQMIRGVELSGEFTE